MSKTGSENGNGRPAESTGVGFSGSPLSSQPGAAAQDLLASDRKLIDAAGVDLAKIDSPEKYANAVMKVAEQNTTNKSQVTFSADRYNYITNAVAGVDFKNLPEENKFDLLMVCKNAIIADATAKRAGDPNLTPAHTHHATALSVKAGVKNPAFLAQIAEIKSMQEGMARLKEKFGEHSSYKSQGKVIGELTPEKVNEVLESWGEPPIAETKGSPSSAANPSQQEGFAAKLERTRTTQPQEGKFR